MHMNRYTHFCGVDPGFNGAFGVINAAGTAAAVYPMPSRMYGEVRQLDMDALDQIFAKLRLPSLCLGIEVPTAYPGTFGNVARDATAFGRQIGTLEAFAHCKGMPFTAINPLRWKKQLGLPGKSHDPDSTQGRALWETTYPQHAALILGPRGGLLDGPLDALLIAHYLRLGAISPLGFKGGKQPIVRYSPLPESCRVI